MDAEIKLDLQKLIVDLDIVNEDFKQRLREKWTKQQTKEEKIKDLNEWALNLKDMDKKKLYHMLKIRNNSEELEKFKEFIEAIENE